MKFVSKNENVTSEYEVVINEEELMKVIRELNEKCCRAVKKTVNVTSNSKEEAIAKINSTDNHGISVVKEVEKLLDKHHLEDFSKKQYVYECEFYYKQISYLQYLLNMALSSYHSKLSDSANENKIIKLLLDYENNDELITYEERMARDGISKDLFFEYENNKDFDFNLLKELYQKAKECFKLVLISEVIHYDDNAKVYKLGERK